MSTEKRLNPAAKSPWPFMLTWRLHYLIPLVAAAVVGYPTLDLPYTLVNDGYIVQHYRAMAAALGSHDWSGAWNLLNSFRFSGRFLPAYHMLNDLSLFLFGEAVKAQRIVHIAKFAVIFVALYALVFRITRRIGPALVSLLPLIFASFIYEKWFRIGAPEATFVSVMAVSLLLFHAAVQRGEHGWKTPFAAAVVILPLMYFSKEVSIAFIPVVGVLFAMLRSFRRDSGTSRKIKEYVGVNLGLVALFLLIRQILSYSITRGTYSSQFATKLSDLLQTCTANTAIYLSTLYSAYFIFFPLPFLLWGYFWAMYLLRRRKERELSPESDYLIWSSTGAAIFLFFLVIYLPWRLPTPVYLVPAVYGFCLLFGLTYARFTEGLARGFLPKPVRKALLFGVALLFLLEVGLPNFYLMFRLQQYLTLRDVTFQQTLESLPAITPKDGMVWTNIPPPEPIYEAKKHLEVFYNRPDISIANLPKSGGIESGDILAFIQPPPGNPDTATWERLNLADTAQFRVMKNFDVGAYSIRPFGIPWLTKGLLVHTKWNCRIFRSEKPLQIGDLTPSHYSLVEGNQTRAGKGLWHDGYLDADNEITLRVPDGPPLLVIKGKIPHWTNYAFPYRFVIRADNGWQQKVSVVKKWPDQFERVIPLDRALFVPGKTIGLKIASDQSFVPSKVDPANADRRKLLFWIDWLGFTKPQAQGK